jgi:hypothetical protein
VLLPIAKAAFREITMRPVPLPRFATSSSLLLGLSLVVTVGCGGSGGGGTAPSSRFTAYALTLPDGANTGQLRMASGGVKLGFVALDGSNARAIIWSAPSDTPTDVSPAGVGDAVATDMVGDTLVGETSGTSRAIRWSLSNRTAVDLQPAGAIGSAALAISGGTIVGWTENSTDTKPVAWIGDSVTPIELPLAGFGTGIASAIDGNAIVGFGSATGSSTSHALLWTGTSTAPVDLQPATGFSGTFATSVSGTTVAGTGLADGVPRPLIWTGPTHRLRNLLPAGAASGATLHVKGTRVVGYVTIGSGTHAALWDVKTGAFTDLHARLASVNVNGSAVTWVSSAATSVDDAGNVYGYANDANHSYPIVWARG